MFNYLYIPNITGFGIIIFGLGLFCVYEIVFFVLWSPELWFWVIYTKEQGPVILLTWLLCMVSYIRTFMGC
jgi:hypothetical protein